MAKRKRRNFTPEFKNELVNYVGIKQQILSVLEYISE